MTRRKFIKNCFQAIQSAALLALLPAPFWKGTAHSALPKPSGYGHANGPCLSEIAAGKFHHAKGRYLNPFAETVQGSLGRVLHWKFFSPNRFKHLYSREKVTPVNIDWERIGNHPGLSVTFLKHASVVIKDKDHYLYIDPVLFDIFWFIKDFSPLAFDLDTLPPADEILITHGHYDHLDKRSLKRIGLNSHVIAPLGYDGLFDGLGLKHRTALDWYDGVARNGREIILLPCNHWTMRNPLTGPNRSLWGSYLIRSAAGPTVFVSGDTGYFEGFHELGREFEIDLAIFNLGAYEPRWFMASSHMNPAETVAAFKALNAKKLLVIHWGTFRLGDEPVYLPPLQIHAEMERQGLSDRLVPLNHGQTWFADHSIRS